MMNYLFGLALLIIGINTSCQHEIKKTRPNVLFIIADDLTSTALSSYGNPYPISPHIDNLAKNGVRYTRSYCQYPVCGPSRASLLSGYYPNATTTYGYVSGREHIGSNRKMLPQLFKENGYWTGRISKIFHMGVPIDIEKGSNGTDDSLSWTVRYNSQGPEWKAKGEGELVQGNPDGTLPVKGGNVMTIVKANGGDSVHSDGKTAQKAVELLHKLKDTSFFLAIGFVRPHVPFVAPKKYFAPYDFEQMDLPKKIPGDWSDIPKRGINYVTSVNGQMNLSQQKKAKAAYFASVSYMDAQVGKVLKALKEEGLDDNTIVVFTSDHGFHLDEHDFWMKVSLHEESAKVPLIIKVPGKAPAVCDSFTELIDLYPTLAELANLSYSQHLQGKSLLSTLDDPEATVRDTAFSVSQGGKSFLLRTSQWAYIQYDEDSGAGMELYDMNKDPEQFDNLANEPEYKPIIEQFESGLKQKLVQIRKNDLEIAYP